ncbi:transcription factor GTE12-like [Lotus japonicus]|uniref:transcription factor GTE12-like n=1 Tax=Lotus japonicus TaxID=34305 RepID=UPI00258A4129|nr:transcription factor GTE12-like [Lotus japonicus]
MAMAETEGRKSLIIKLYLPCSGKREAPFSEAMDSNDGKKRRKVDSSLAVSDSEEENDHLKKKKKEVPKNRQETEKKRRTVSEESDESKKKEYHYCKNEEKQSKIRETKLIADSRISRTESEESKKENTNNKKKKMMDRYRKMQCWVILKRFIIGRDGWAFKHPLLVDDNSDSDVLNNNNNKKQIGLVDIETRLSKGFYSEPEQFADDIRLVFSHAMLYYPHPRNEIHRIARRLSENFEVTWKSLKDKWTCEDRKQKAGKRTRSLV